MKKRILFICGHNSGRSQMAEVYFNISKAGSEWEAISAGTGIAGNKNINPRVAKFLLDNGIDIHNQEKEYYPKELTRDMLESANIICTMGCMDCDIIGGRKSDYDFGLDDPANKDTNLEDVFSSLKSQMKRFL